MLCVHVRSAVAGARLGHAVHVNVRQRSVLARDELDRGAHTVVPQVDRRSHQVSAVLLCSQTTLSASCSLFTAHNFATGRPIPTLFNPIQFLSDPSAVEWISLLELGIYTCFVCLLQGGDGDDWRRSGRLADRPPDHCTLAFCCSSVVSLLFLFCIRSF